MRKIVEFLKRETVLTIVWIGAVISAFFVQPSFKYVNYIDWRSLGILWSLMAVVQGLKNNYVFDKLAWALLGKTKWMWQLYSVLILLCFISSMLITNDVALITFVPFAVMMLKKCKHEEMLIPIIVLQTVAANLGSMLTPIGNPQNLYLYGISGLNLFDFILTMLPYTLIALVLLTISVILLKGKKNPINMFELVIEQKEKMLDSSIRLEEGKNGSEEENKKMTNNRTIFLRIMIYGILFVCALLTVIHVLPFYVLLPLVFFVVLVMEKEIIGKVDYILLLTFVGFFIFTGNIGNISQIKDYLQQIVQGNELLAGICVSQGISNVPATLLLSGFSDKYLKLLVGVNIGGLGTLIASMASLISYKIYVNEYSENKGKYFGVFTLVNVTYLGIYGLVIFLMP